MIKNLRELNKRQEKIIAILEKSGKFSVSRILQEVIEDLGKPIAKITIIRDLKQLIEFGFIESEGRGRAVVYGISKYFNFIKPINAEDYFKLEVDKRKGLSKFNFEIFSFIKNIFYKEEIEYLEKLNNEYKNNIKKLNSEILKREFERLTIELSWKSSQIEGNTYTLLETESLIKENHEAKGHKKEEAIMILNHKKTLDYIRKNTDSFKNMSIAKIENIHFLLTKNLGISRNIRKFPVGITGTKYRPFDNEFQIKEALEKTCRLINNEKNHFTKTLFLSIMIAYIQPFSDGNKRTSRLASNAVLMAHNICPLSYRSVDENEYKKAVILFYEQNNINYFKKLFIEQFEFAVKNYFRV
ncbi:Fic family protein [Candidatus Wolfebacteria bacterium]|nr:Fic family protein [Candidatus Wolfebacteria bacterium]